jgi:hypothetical protein
MTKEKYLARAFLFINSVAVLDNSRLACDPSKWPEAWRETINVSPNPNSGQLYTFQFQAAPVTGTVFTIVRPPND